MATPFTHGLLPMACALTSACAVSPLSRRESLRLALVAAALGNFPDLDLIPASLFPSHFFALHRELGHNVFSLGVGIWLGVMALRWAVPRLFREKRAWLFSSALVLSHVLFDASADFTPVRGTRAGVPLLWPLSNWELVTDWPIFGGYTLERAAHPLLSYLQSREFWEVLFSTEVAFTTAVIAGWWLATKAWVGLRRTLAAREPLPDPRFRLKP